jgi:hypothetical protein
MEQVLQTTAERVYVSTQILTQSNVVKATL